MKVVNLTLEISPNIRVFPGSPKPSFIRWSKFDIHGYDSEVMFLSTHTGTHIDAPSHFISGADNINQVAINRFVCKNTLLLKMEQEANQMITRDDIIETGCNIYEKDNNYVSDNPGLSADAAKFLAEKKVNAIAIDGPSIDIGVDNNFTAHKIFLSNDTLIIENLCNLEKLNNQRLTLIVTPLKLIGASGSPVRAIGIEEDTS
ncbi:MAG: cyclase family protein [Nitrososphaeraceae archaeon]